MQRKKQVCIAAITVLAVFTITYVWRSTPARRLDPSPQTAFEVAADETPSPSSTFWTFFGKQIPALVSYSWQPTTHSISYSSENWFSNPPLFYGDRLDIYGKVANEKHTCLMNRMLLISHARGEQYIDTVVIRVNWLQKVTLLVHSDLRIAISFPQQSLNAR